MPITIEITKKNAAHFVMLFLAGSAMVIPLTVQFIPLFAVKFYISIQQTMDADEQIEASKIANSACRFAVRLISWFCFAVKLISWFWLT